MKKKIILLLGIFSLIALAGGIYLVIAIERNVSDFDDIIMLHKIENLREHLLMSIQKVETDLYSQNTLRPQSTDSVMDHLHTVDRSISDCLGCHHSAYVQERLEDLNQQIRQYDDAITGILAREKNSVVNREDVENAHIIGDSLIGKVETMVILTNKKLYYQTEDALHHVHKMKVIMLIIIAAGPVLMILFAASVIKGVTGPVLVLLQATRKVKAGDLEHRITGLKDEFGELAVAFNDMAESLRGNVRSLEESEKRYRLLFENAADAIFILGTEGDEAGRIVQANHAAAKMHYCTVEELRGMKIQDLDTPESALRARSRIERILKGEWIKAEIEHRRKDGSVFPVEVSAGPFDVGGKTFILAMDRDITERKQAEKELQRTERIRAAGELATGLAHEIKNPLAGIKVSMEALSEESSLSNDDREILKRVIGEIKRIEYLMKGLLNFAHPPKPQLANTDVNAILENVSTFVLKDHSLSRDDGNSISLVRDLADDIPEIMADAMQLQQIFLNLMMNAVDAMPHGGTMTVRTRYFPDSNYLKVELSDTGSGIDPDAMTKIFNPFFTTKSKGTGLGLSITKRLVEEHGGRIRLVNNENGGVTCSVSLPIKKLEGALTA